MYTFYSNNKHLTHEVKELLLYSKHLSKLNSGKSLLIVPV